MSATTSTTPPTAFTYRVLVHSGGTSTYHKIVASPDTDSTEARAEENSRVARLPIQRPVTTNHYHEPSTGLLNTAKLFGAAGVFFAAKNVAEFQGCDPITSIAIGAGAAVLSLGIGYLRDPGQTKMSLRLTGGYAVADLYVQMVMKHKASLGSSVDPSWVKEDYGSTLQALSREYYQPLFIQKLFEGLLVETDKRRLSNIADILAYYGSRVRTDLETFIADYQDSPRHRSKVEYARAALNAIPQKRAKSRQARKMIA